MHVSDVGTQKICQNSMSSKLELLIRRELKRDFNALAVIAPNSIFESIVSQKVHCSRVSMQSIAYVFGKFRPINAQRRIGYEEVVRYSSNNHGDFGALYCGLGLAFATNGGPL